MTFEFHRNHYQSPRGPSDSAVMVRMPRSLSRDLTALTLAYEEPKYSILLRIIEEYVDSHQDDVEKGRWRMSHYDPEGWDDGPADGTCDRRTDEDRGTDRTFQRCRPVPDAYHYTHIPPWPSSETRTWQLNLSTRTS